MTADLVAFLRARLDEDEQVARGTSGREWWEHPTNWVSTPPLNRVGLVVHDGDRSHILRHDPARVLADVEAERRILDEIVDEVEQMDDQIEAEFGSPNFPPQTPAHVKLLRLLALPYAGHPDYREDWRP